MQREIKFRGIYVDTGEFVYGSLILGLMKDPEFEVIFDGTTYYKVKAETVGQYIDLPDKNGWQIYEGDVVKVTDDGEIVEGNSDTGIGKIIFGWGGWYITEKIENSLDDIKNSYEIEIIGNIHMEEE